jgi:hypothetical protein
MDFWDALVLSGFSKAGYYFSILTFWKPPECVHVLLLGFSVLRRRRWSRSCVFCCHSTFWCLALRVRFSGRCGCSPARATSCFSFSKVARWTPVPLKFFRTGWNTCYCTLQVIRWNILFNPFPDDVKHVESFAVVLNTLHGRFLSLLFAKCHAKAPKPLLKTQEWLK